MSQDYHIIIDSIVDLSNLDNLLKNCQLADESEAKVIYIDASQVERLRTPAFQLIIAFKNYLEAQGRELIINSPSEAFKNMANCLGLNKLL